MIISSPVTLAKETAEKLKKHFILDIPIIEDKNIREVNWDLSRLISNEAYEKGRQIGSYDIEDKRYEEFIKGTGLTSLDEVIKRLTRFKNDLIKIEYKHILCITHSFLMKVIYLYFLNGLKEKYKYKPEMLRRPVRIGYLDGFDYYQ